MKKKAMRIAYYLQRLSEMKFKKNDEEAFVEACKEHKIPAEYVKSLGDVVFPKIVTNLPWPPW